MDEPPAANPEVDDLVMSLGIGDEFPGTPQTLGQVLQINPDEEGAFDRYLACLSSEPGLAAKILKVANSAVLGTGVEIANLRSALIRLGTATTHSVIISVLIMDTMKEDAGLLTHSAACGAFASRVSAAAGVGNPDDAFAAGMLHDIGKIFLRMARRKRNAGEYVEKEPQSELHYGDQGLAQERNEFGVDHAYVGHWLAARWNFPESLRAVIRDHHALPPDASLCTHVVAKGNEWTRNYYRTSFEDAPKTEEIMFWAERHLNLPRARFLEAVQHIPSDVAAMVDHFVDTPAGSQRVLWLLQKANITLGELNFRHEFLHRRMTRQLRNLTLLQGLSSEVSACAGQRAMCDKVVELISSRLQLGVVSILLPGPNGRLFVQSAVGLPKEIIGDPNVPSMGSIGRWVFEHGHSLLLKEFSPHGDFRSSAFSSRYAAPSALSVPLRQGSAILGVLNVNNKADKTPFDEEDQQIFEVLAQTTGTLLHADFERAKRERADLRFRSLAAKTPIAMVGFDLTGTVWLWNRAAHVLTGISAVDVIGSRLPSVLLPRGDDAILNRWTSEIREGRAIEREECVLYLPDGAEGHVLYTVFPLEGNELGVWAGVNISKERAAQFRAQRRSAEMEATQQVLQEILGDLDQVSIMNSFAERVTRVLSLDKCVVLVRDSKTKELNCAAQIGFADMAEAVRYLPAVRTLAERAYANGELMLSNLTVGETPETRAFISACGIRNLMAAPLRIHHETVGIACVFNKRLRAFIQDDLDVLRDLANVASVGLRVAEVHAQRVHDEQLRTTVGMAVTYNHEVNNPLQIILSSAELAGKHPKLPEELKKTLRQIEESAERIANVNERLRTAVMLTFRDYLGDLPMIEVNETKQDGDK